MTLFEHVPADFPDKILGKQERNLTDPPVPFSEKEGLPPSVSAKPAPSSKKRSLFDGKGIAIAVMLGLATGIAVSSDWSWTHSLTENWKSNNLRAALNTDASKGQPAAQAAPATAVVTAPDVSEILNQLNTIARDLSSVQQNINELAAGQEQIRKAQGQAAVLQAHLVNLQTVANAKQNKQSAPAPAPTEGRKFYRGDYRYMYRYPPP